MEQDGGPADRFFSSFPFLGRSTSPHTQSGGARGGDPRISTPGHGQEPHGIQSASTGPAPRGRTRCAPLVLDPLTAAGASAPADAVVRFTAGEAMQTARPTSASGDDDDEDTGSEEYSDDRASD